ncbi:MAG TPA: hypothetical protein VFB45_24745, partial [Pseudolabrys sp.]|nr:hypothetical protein [Pseudolabrys sp.]
SASNTTVASAGKEFIYAGGSASGATIASGGTQYVYGSATGTTLSGGTEYVYAGGTASNTTINGADGFVKINTGATLSGVTLNGGTLEITSGGSVGAASLTFVSGGMLQLDNSQTFSGTISGFNSTNPDKIDLVDIAFGAQTTLGYTSSTNSGTLQVSDGTHTANLLLLGNYVAGNFTAQTDGHGGTLITDPPVITPPHS